MSAEFRGTLLWARCHGLPDPPGWLQDLDLSLIDDYAHPKYHHLVNSGFTQIPAHVDTRNDIYRNRTITLDSNVRVSSNSARMVYFNEEISLWAKQHVTRWAKDLRYFFTKPPAPVLGPHADISRDWTLIYLFNTGGIAPATVFFQEKNHPDLIRPRGYTVEDISNLQEIERISIPQRSWTLINSRVLHAVVGLGDQIRQGLQISTDQIPDDIPWAEHFSVS